MLQFRWPKGYYSRSLILTVLIVLVLLLQQHYVLSNVPEPTDIKLEASATSVIADAYLAAEISELPKDIGISTKAAALPSDSEDVQVDVFYDTYSIILTFFWYNDAVLYVYEEVLVWDSGHVGNVDYYLWHVPSLEFRPGNSNEREDVFFIRSGSFILAKVPYLFIAILTIFFLPILGLLAEIWF